MKTRRNFCIISTVVFMNRIRDLRIESGLKQEDLAGQLSVRRQTISRYETGTLDLDTDTIRRLCEIFGVTADYLLGFSTQRRPEISDADAAVVAAYHAAPESVRAGIDALLAPYRPEEKESAAG